MMASEDEQADENRTIEATGQSYFIAPVNIYKATVKTIDGERMVLYTRAGGFDLARHTILMSIYCKDQHGRLMSLAEVSGVWVE